MNRMLSHDRIDPAQADLPGRILIVDDDEMLCDTLKDVLVEDGHTVKSAANGKLGLSELMKDRFDVLITDLNMPEMQGLDLLSAIRDRKLDVCPVVLTGYGTIEAAVQSMKLGAFDYVLKPFDVGDLKKTVWHCIGRIREERRSPVRVNLDRLHGETMESLLAALEAKDPYTRGHSERVARYACMLAEGLGLPSDHVRMIEQAGRLHDIGKIGVRMQYLAKQGPLTQEEHELYKLHVTFGKKILDEVTPLREISEMAYQHHERFDGDGYLTGAKGEKIPLGGRILIVCDSFDAMTSDRPYRPKLPLGVATQELERCSGTQFDADLVKVFLGELRKKFPPGEFKSEEIVIAREHAKAGLGSLVFTKKDFEKLAVTKWNGKAVSFDRY